MKNQSAKRVNIVNVKLVRESSMLYKNHCVRSLEDRYQLLKQFLGEMDREYFVVVCLDTKNQPTAINICHIGSLNASIVHPRECFKLAILSNAVAILVGHNHPSGKSAEIREDVEVTKKLIEAGKIIGIDVLDHIVLDDGGVCFPQRKRIHLRGEEKMYLDWFAGTMERIFNIEVKSEDVGYEAYDFYHEELDELLIPAEHLEKLPDPLLLETLSYVDNGGYEGLLVMYWIWKREGSCTKY